LRWLALRLLHGAFLLSRRRCADLLCVARLDAQGHGDEGSHEVSHARFGLLHGCSAAIQLQRMPGLFSTHQRSLVGGEHAALSFAILVMAPAEGCDAR
jgi:hypothetical protein